jgi:hypothetical protein
MKLVAATFHFVLHEAANGSVRLWQRASVLPSFLPSLTTATTTTVMKLFAAAIHFVLHEANGSVRLWQKPCEGKNEICHGRFSFCPSRG